MRKRVDELRNQITDTAIAIERAAHNLRLAGSASLPQDLSNAELRAAHQQLAQQIRQFDAALRAMRSLQSKQQQIWHNAASGG